MLAHAGPDRRSTCLHATVQPRPGGGPCPRWVEVELITCHFPYGCVPEEKGYRVRGVYRRSSRAVHRRPSAPPVPRSTSPTCGDTGGWQITWISALPVASDCRTRPPPASPEAPARLHDALAPAGARQPDRAVPHRLLAEMDAVVVHSEHGRRRLEEDFGVPAERPRVIPHGAFTYLIQQDDLPHCRRSCRRSRGR